MNLGGGVFVPLKTEIIGCPETSVNTVTTIVRLVTSSSFGQHNLIQISKCLVLIFYLFSFLIFAFFLFLIISYRVISAVG